MQFKVPQNIDMKDKIIGPLTLSQFFYLLFGGVILYILFARLVPAGLGLIFWILAVPIGIFSFAMAFVKVNDRPFPFFVLAFINYLARPRQRIWAHYEKPAPIIAPQPKKAEKPAAPKKNFDTVRVRELSEILDRPVSSSNTLNGQKKGANG